MALNRHTSKTTTAIGWQLGCGSTLTSIAQQPWPYVNAYLTTQLLVCKKFDAEYQWSCPDCRQRRYGKERGSPKKKSLCSAHTHTEPKQQNTSKNTNSTEIESGWHFRNLLVAHTAWNVCLVPLGKVLLVQGWMNIMWTPVWTVAMTRIAPRLEWVWGEAFGANFPLKKSGTQMQNELKLDQNCGHSCASGGLEARSLNSDVIRTF